MEPAPKICSGDRGTYSSSPRRPRPTSVLVSLTDCARPILSWAAIKGFIDHQSVLRVFRNSLTIEKWEWMGAEPTLLLGNALKLLSAIIYNLIATYFIQTRQHSNNRTFQRYTSSAQGPKYPHSCTIGSISSSPGYNLPRGGRLPSSWRRSTVYRPRGVAHIPQTQCMSAMGHGMHRGTIFFFPTWSA